MDTKTITGCELQVMMVIWDSEKQLTLPEILKNVNEKYGKEWKAPTVSTFLSRLVRKDFLSMKRTGRTFIYDSLVAKEVYKEKVLTEDITFWCKDDLVDLLETIGKNRKFTTAEKGKFAELSK